MFLDTNIFAITMKHGTIYLYADKNNNNLYVVMSISSQSFSEQDQFCVFPRLPFLWRLYEYKCLFVYLYKIKNLLLLYIGSPSKDLLIKIKLIFNLFVD